MDRQIYNLFRENNGILRTKQLTDHGIHYRKLQALLEKGVLVPVRRGYYQLQDQQSFSDIPLLSALFPEGILCMESALQCYGYTDRTPDAWHIAVPSGTARKRFDIDYPFVKAHYVADSKFSVGKSTAQVDGFSIAVYDRERTICDILFHRSKLDAEVFNTAIQRYLKDDQRNITNLIPYAAKLRVEKKVREVLGIWL